MTKYVERKLEWDTEVDCDCTFEEVELSTVMFA